MLDTKYSFSFHNDYDPQHMGFRALRVINQDRVAAVSSELQLRLTAETNAELLLFDLS